MVVLQTVFPVFVMIAIGYALGRITEIDIKPIAFLSIYVLAPALYFCSLVKTSLTAPEFLQILCFIILLSIGTTLLVKVWGKIEGWDPKTEKSVLLAALFPIYCVLMNLLSNTLGVYLAAQAHLSPKESLINVLKMPGLWAMALALGLTSLELTPPEMILKPLQMMGEAVIPVMLVTLGIHLAKVKVGANIWLAGKVTILKLVVAPLIGLLILYLFFDPSSLTSKVALVESACPVAVASTMFSIQFNARPELVSTAALTSTIASIFTFALLLHILL
jgi:predicted permease